jgi:2-methylcitrate dehydratase
MRTAKCAPMQPGLVELAERLARYALSLRFSALDARTVKETKERIIDALGCAMGAYDERPVEIARAAVSKLDHAGGATILGTASTTSPDLATFVNGLMVRYFDFNDTYLSKEPAHPSDNIAPCFAVGEAEDSTGKDIIAGAVAAYEIQCRLCDAADIRHRGWDHVNYGLVSTPLAASRLMGLGVAKAVHSVNIALNAHIAMRQVRAGELSMWKGASFANAARNGVFAATLAREGMSGPAPIFEGEMGFFRQVSGPFELDVEGFGGGKRSYKINESYIKYWPAEYHAQTAIWAALEVRKKIASPHEVESVTVETHEAGYTILGKDREKWEPKTKETADHSLPYIVAAALLKGTVDNSTYSERNISNPRILAFMRKVKVAEDPGFTAMYPAKGMPNRVKVKTADGREVAAQVDVPRGHPLNPMSSEEIEEKFLGLTSRRLGERDAKNALRRLWRLEEERDLGELLGLLRARRGSKA